MFIAELTGVYFTGGSLNPARSFGPAVVDRKFSGYHWIYWLGPVLGSLVAAGFYKFIKVLEYETANPGQDMDHAAKVDKKARLLMAAGISEADAHHVAKELAEQQIVAEKGGPDGVIVANGQGRKSQEVERNGMYGTNFRANSREQLNRPSDGSDATAVQRPAAVTTGSLLGRYSYLGRAGRQPSVADNPAVQAALLNEGRTDSPSMATHDEIYAPLQEGQAERLGGMVADNEPRNRFARTASSGV